MSGSHDGPRLAGRRALVTGAGSGIGRAAARRLAAEGAAVAVTDVRPESAEEVAAEITGAGGRAVAAGADVGDEASVRTALDTVVGPLGGLDAVVACAGITIAGATHDLTLDAWDTMLRINATGMFLTLKHALPHLLEAGGGAIVTIGSVGSVVAAGRTSAYDASKGAVLQLTRAVAVEYVEQGVRANCILPGMVRTGLARNSREVTAMPTDAGQGPAPSSRLRVPMERFAEPDEIAAVAAFLCSDDASFLTGAAVPVDGGYTAI